MGLYKNDWIDLMGTDASKWSVGSGSTRSANIACDAFFKLSVKVVVVFKAGADDNVEIGIYSQDNNGANELDSKPLWNQKIQEIPGTERRITIPNLDVSALDGLTVIVKNNDTDTSLNVWVSYKAAINS